MKSVIIIILTFVFSLNAFASSKKAIIKANIIKGESFVTANSSEFEIEQVLREALTEKDYEVVETINGNDGLLYIDIFIFQYPADYPTATITIRTQNGIHYIDKESVKLFVNREAANLLIAKKAAERIPDEIDVNFFYDLSITDILSNERLSLTGTVSNSITKGYRSNYSSVIKWPDGDNPHFIAPDGFEQYLSYCSNFQGLRNKLREENIEIILKINEKARFEILKINSPFELNAKQKLRIHNIINAFPLWIVEKEIENIELMLGIK